jgi:anthranilate/para-aminobenzoate synthase component I
MIGHFEQTKYMTYQAGAGIVAASKPADELQESISWAL